MDYRKLAIADCIRHPIYGIVSYQPDQDAIKSDTIRVMSRYEYFLCVSAKECVDDITEEEMVDYWDYINRGKHG